MAPKAKRTLSRGSSGLLPGRTAAPRSAGVGPVENDSSQGYTYGAPGFAADAYPVVSEGVDAIYTGTSTVQYLKFPHPLEVTSEPLEWTLPQDALGRNPPPEAVHKFFFKGTAKEVAVRQIFFHTPLSEQEKNWLRTIRDFCRWKRFPLPEEMDPFLLRICYYNWRKHGEKGWLSKSFSHIKEVMNWRANYCPFSDQDPAIRENLTRGVMYWAARDATLQPLLIIRLMRLGKNVTAENFKKLTVFCFEWAMRYLFVPGIVETCNVVFDVRNVALHSFPMSALSDMTTTLTRQYPFRLGRMIIVNDSLFIQTVWQIAKQFLTEVQQQKMMFMRQGFEKELLKTYAAHHLEVEFGGTRPSLTSFYPFPLPPRPFGPNIVQDPRAVPNCHRAVGPETVKGRYWLSDMPPICWSAEAPQIFAYCKLPPPPLYVGKAEVEAAAAKQTAVEHAAAEQGATTLQSKQTASDAATSTAGLLVESRHDDSATSSTTRYSSFPRGGGAEDHDYPTIEKPATTPTPAAASGDTAAAVSPTGRSEFAGGVDAANASAAARSSFDSSSVADSPRSTGPSCEAAGGATASGAQATVAAAASAAVTAVAAAAAVRSSSWAASSFSLPAEDGVELQRQQHRITAGLPSRHHFDFEESPPSVGHLVGKGLDGELRHLESEKTNDHHQAATSSAAPPIALPSKVASSGSKVGKVERVKERSSCGWCRRRKFLRWSACRGGPQAVRQQSTLH